MTTLRHTLRGLQMRPGFMAVVRAANMSLPDSTALIVIGGLVPGRDPSIAQNNLTPASDERRRHGNTYTIVHWCENSSVNQTPPRDPGPEPACTPEDHRNSARRKPTVSDESLELASRLFRAIGDKARLRMLAQLAQGDMCVTEMAEAEGESISTISQRLRVLRAEKLVVRRRRGKHINYALADQHVMDLLFNALAHATERPAAPVSTT
jgi:DNA-binding transcriptional ArsR family regulator